MRPEFVALGITFAVLGITFAVHILYMCYVILIKTLGVGLGIGVMLGALLLNAIVIIKFH